MNCQASRPFIVGLSLLAALSSTAWGAYPPQDQLLNQAEFFCTCSIVDSMPTPGP